MKINPFKAFPLALAWLVLLATGLVGTGVLVATAIAILLWALVPSAWLKSL
jgi:hypothetical protein